MCGIWALLSKSEIKSQKYGQLFSSFMKIKNRGPDYSSFDLVTPELLIGFHRLAIMDLSADGNQPFHYVRKDGSCVYCICNGEIYDHEKIKRDYDIKTKSQSDCEIIIPLYEKLGVDNMIRLLGSEFAFIILDISKDGQVKLIAGRDPIGVRPLFYGIDDDSICLSSEVKGLHDIYDQIYVFNPGSYMVYENGNFNITKYYTYKYKQLEYVPPIEDIYSEIRRRFLNCVQKRLMTERPFGALLSGGLDSSLVCGAIKYLQPNLKFPVFTIAFKSGSTDLPYAKQVAEFLGLEHHTIEVDEDTALSAIDETIMTIESYDITSIRASTMQLLVARYIKSNSLVRVLFCGENSDELYAGYKYSHYAPNFDSLREDNIRLVREVHRYDGLRTDRTMSDHGLEVRLPFADPEMIDYVFSLPSELTAPKDGLEKALLRNAFKNYNILPTNILFRIKEALSDGCSGIKRSWYQIIQEHIETLVTDEEYNENKNKFTHNTPFTKESYYYRKKFTEYFGDSDEKAKLIPHFWMPKWTEATDPSARTL
ncbi:asparagine synthase [Indivirus ILV1]|uniref:asparagine synthase (glutamine-hydrolyzing) n=1 Tax=Indivirus ILV1 TaxID=1977633 RepID=A0A1V0SCP4_9VIRU|nr:asparagine synthase [Indivirus ILV1]